MNSALPVQLHNPDITYRLFRRKLKGHQFREARTQHSVTSDTQYITYLLLQPYFCECFKTTEYNTNVHANTLLWYLPSARKLPEWPNCQNGQSGDKFRHKRFTLWCCLTNMAIYSCQSVRGVLMITVTYLNACCT